MLQGWVHQCQPALHAGSIHSQLGLGLLGSRRWDETAVNGRASNQRLGYQLPASITACGLSPDNPPT